MQPQGGKCQAIKRIGDYYYRFEDRIGRGSFADVYKGKNIKNPTEIVAMKVINLSNLNNNNRDAKQALHLKQEILIMQKCTHKNIVQLISTIQTDNNMYLILQWCNGGDLHGYLNTHRFIPENVARKFAIQLRDGLHYLLSQNVIHRDLKPQNILLSEKSENSILRVADFGFARHIGPTDDLMDMTVVGTPLYMALELLQHRPYNSKADLWSLGCIIYQMVAGIHPFKQARSRRELETFIRRYNIPHMIDRLHISSDLNDLLSKLLTVDVKNRMDWSAFVSHRWWGDKQELQPESMRYSQMLFDYFALPNHDDEKSPEVNPNHSQPYKPEPQAQSPTQTLPYQNNTQQPYHQQPQQAYQQQQQPYQIAQEYPNPDYSQRQPQPNTEEKINRYNFPQPPQQQYYPYVAPPAPSHTGLTTIAESMGRKAPNATIMVKWQSTAPAGMPIDVSDDLCTRLESMQLKTQIYYPNDNPTHIIYRESDSTCNRMDITNDDSVNLQRIEIIDIPSLESRLGCISNPEPPNWWKPCNNSVDIPLNLNLNQESSEYKSVEERFKIDLKSSMQSTVVSIENIQNRAQWFAYQKRHESFEKKLGLQHLNEAYLWFGGSPDTLNLISEQGLSAELFATANQFGKGLYFSIKPHYFIQDGIPKNGGAFITKLLLCRVITGDSAQGSQHRYTPPHRLNDNTPYETMVDSTTDPSVYVVCTNCQAYPEFLVTIRTVTPRIMPIPDRPPPIPVDDSIGDGWERIPLDAPRQQSRQQPRRQPPPQKNTMIPSKNHTPVDSFALAFPDLLPLDNEAKNAPQRIQPRIEPTREPSPDPIMRVDSNIATNLSALLPPTDWKCVNCSYDNADMSQTCFLCTKPRPELPPLNIKGEWQCPRCPTLNIYLLRQCESCNWPYATDQ